MLKFEKSQYLNTISQLNHTRSNKGYHTKLFNTKRSEHLNHKILLILV